MTRARLQDLAEIKRHGYRVEPLNPDARHKGYVLLDSAGYSLMIGDHGQVSPTEWEAVAEALDRIEADAR